MLFFASSSLETNPASQADGSLRPKKGQRKLRGRILGGCMQCIVENGGSFFGIFCCFGVLLIVEMVVLVFFFLVWNVLSYLCFFGFFLLVLGSFRSWIGSKACLLPSSPELFDFKAYLFNERPFSFVQNMANSAREATSFSFAHLGRLTRRHPLAGDLNPFINESQTEEQTPPTKTLPKTKPQKKTHHRRPKQTLWLSTSPFLGASSQRPPTLFAASQGSLSAQERAERDLRNVAVSKVKAMEQVGMGMGGRRLGIGIKKCGDPFWAKLLFFFFLVSLARGTGSFWGRFVHNI